MPHSLIQINGMIQAFCHAFCRTQTLPDMEVEAMFQEGDKGIAMNVGKTVLALIALMFVLIFAANVIG